MTNCRSLGSYQRTFNLSNRLDTSHDLAIGGCRVVALGRGWLGLKGGEDRKWKSRHAVHHAIATSTDPSVMMLVGKGSKRRIEWCVFGANGRSFVNGKGAKNVLKWEREGVQFALLKGLGLKAVHCTALHCELVKVVKGNLSKWMTTPQTLWDIGSEREMEWLGHPSGE